MIIVRPIQKNDIEKLLALAEAAYPGMTTLPPDREALVGKIERSTQSVSKEVSTPGPETYLMVMEDTETGKLVGTAGIIARLGEDDQFYSYKLNKVTQNCQPLNKKVTLETLHLTNHFEGFAEVATLFLLEPYRKDGNGKLLARSRYLFMAQFRERFPEQVMADLRGYFDDEGRSPFWEALGQHFFGMSYSDADLFGALNGNQFIADLMPKHPIYVNLLPKDAQEVIGRPNDQGRPALAMLEKEGFRCNGQVDIFDGAPSVDAFIDDLKTIKNSHIGTFVGDLDDQVDDDISDQLYLVSTGDIANFTVCLSKLVVTDNNAVLLPSETIKTLGLSIQDSIRYVVL